MHGILDGLDPQLVVAVADAAGGVAAATHGLAELGGTLHAAEALVEQVEAAELASGTLWVANDRVGGGATPADVTAFRPVHDGGRLVALALARATWPAGWPATGEDRYAEGLVVTPVLVGRDGQPGGDALAVLLANVHDRRGVGARVAAQAEALGEVARRLAATDGLGAALTEAQASSERAVRGAIAPLPGAQGRGAAAVRDAAVVVEARRAGDALVLRTTGTADAVPWPGNATPIAARAAVEAGALEALGVAAADAGAVRPLLVEIAPGSVLDPPAWAPRGDAGATLAAVWDAARAAVAQLGTG